CGALALAAAGGCGASLPQPARAPQPANAFVDVPYPPPAGRVEVLPARPSPDAVWIDGQWIWDGANWAWDDGGWAVPPEGARYARSEVRRLADGRLEFAPGSWRDATGREIPPPPLTGPQKRSASQPVRPRGDAMGRRVKR